MFYENLLSFKVLLILELILGSKQKLQIFEKSYLDGNFALLLFASSKNRVDLFKTLKSDLSQADFEDLLTQRDEDGYSALHRAANSGSYQMAALLLKHGAQGRVN